MTIIIAAMTSRNTHLHESVRDDTHPLVSIVANFYKSEKYINRLIRSVLAQDYDNWELIAVNDCSPGKDGEMLEQWSGKTETHCRIRVINNPVNLGISKAKRVGINAAKGRYITFIDGDDWLMPKALRCMVVPAVEHDLDLVVSDVWHVYPPAWLTGFNRRLMTSTADYDTVIDRKEIFNRYIYHFFGSHSMSFSALWGRLFRTDMLRATPLPKDMPGDFHEDYLLNLEYMEKCERLMFIKEPTYCWRWGGITSGSKKRKIDDYRWRGIIDQSAYLHRLRLGKIRKYGLDKALVPLRIELKNILVESLCQVAEYGSDQQVCSAIDYCHTLPEYDEIMLIPLPEVKRFKEFITMYAAHDNAGICRFLRKTLHEKRFRHLLRRIVLALS